MPYLIIFSAKLILGRTISKLTAIIFILVLVLICSLGIISCIICNIVSLKEKNGKKSASRNIVIKVCHIPVHLFMFLIFGGMMNPFLIMASWIPIALSISLLAFSGLANTGACINLFRNKKCGLFTAILLLLSSFIYLIDFIAGMVQLSKSGK